MKKTKITIILIISLVFCFGILIVLKLPKKEANELIKYNTYNDLGIISAKKPYNTRLWWELDNGYLLLVDSISRRDLLISTDKADNWDSFGTGSFTSGKISDDRNIIAGFFDRGNDVIYFIGWEAGIDGDKVQCWQLNVSTYIASDLGSSIDANNAPGDAIGIDVWVRDSKIEVLLRDDNGTSLRWEVFQWVDPNWVYKDFQTIQDTTYIPAVIIGTNAYYVSVLDMLHSATVVSFDGTSLIQRDGISNVDGPTNDNMLSMSYDETNKLYFTLYSTTDAENRLFSWNLTTVEETKLDAYEVVLMLDRNTASGVMEKAYHLTEYKVYQLHPYAYQLHYIAKIDTDAVLVAITDNFLMNNNGDMFEFINISDKIKEVIIDTEIGQITTSEVITEETIIAGQTVRIYDDSDNIQFMGQVYKRDSKDGKEFTYKCVGYDKEISRKYTASYSSKTAKQIMQYMLDGDMNGDGTATVALASFLYYNNSIDNTGSFTTTYTLSFKNKTIKEIYDTLMDFEDGEWYIAPDGKVYAFALVDIPTSGETITQASNKIYGAPPEISQMMWELNKISLYGAIVSGARLQNEAGYGEDVPSQQLNGINEFLRHYPHVNSQTAINTLADAILARTGLTNNPIYIEISFKEIGFEQVGKTLNFQFTPYVDLLVATDYYILSQVYYAKEDIATLVLSSGIIQEGREHEATLNQTSSADEEQIDILAGIAGAGGEVNEGANVGSDGIGVYDAKAGVILQFRHIASVNAKLTVVLNGKDIDLTVVVGTTADSVCVGNDSRLSDSRTPLAHILGTSGPHTGTLPWSDLSKTGSSLADLATKAHSNLSDAPTNAHHNEDHDNAHHTTNYEVAFSKNSAFNKDFGTLVNTVCQGNDGRLSDSRAPTQHALDSATYHTINANTIFNATTTKHGFLKQLDNDSAHFLNGQGNWAAPPGTGGGSAKGQLQGHVVPIAGCVWGSTHIDMYDLDDSAQCIFHLSDNISASHDITVVMVYAPRNTYTTPTMNLYMALTRTDDTEVFSWNYKNGEATSMTLCTGADRELKRKEWVIPHASFDQNDLLNIYWVNTNAYDYRVHAIILKYTEA